MVGYTVKSGYKLLYEDARSDADTVLNSEAVHSFWKGIWKMHVPEKIKHFEWRSACSNALTTKMNLVKRKILDDDICSVPKNPSLPSLPCGSVKQSSHCGTKLLAGLTGEIRFTSMKLHNH